MYDVPLDPELVLASQAAGLCGGWIVALALLGVGLVSVRKAHKTAGLLVAAAGALGLFVGCCGVPSMLMPYYGPMLGETGGQLAGAVRLLFELGGTGLVIAGAVVLSKAARQAGGAR